MTKLDEIEKAVNNAIVLRRTPEKPLLEMREMRLLVRAVRQLGRETMAWYSSRPDLAVERIDPDVLELLEEA